jgi:Uma2 family endonuclease
MGENAGHGEACDEVGVLLSRNPDNLLGPDAAFLTRASLPPRLSPEGYLLTIPELVVEVRSKNDTQQEIDDKVRDYLAAGVLVVWVADPAARTVTAYRANQTAFVSGAGDVLTADPVIPGFAAPVADLLPA